MQQSHPPVFLARTHWEVEKLGRRLLVYHETRQRSIKQNNHGNYWCESHVAKENHLEEVEVLAAKSEKYFVMKLTTQQTITTYFSRSLSIDRVVRTALMTKNELTNCMSWKNWNAGSVFFQSLIISSSLNGVMRRKKYEWKKTSSRAEIPRIPWKHSIVSGPESSRLKRLLRFFWGEKAFKMWWSFSLCLSSNWSLLIVKC
jgi:ribosomal protein S6